MILGISSTILAADLSACRLKNHDRDGRLVGPGNVPVCCYDSCADHRSWSSASRDPSLLSRLATFPSCWRHAETYPKRRTGEISHTWWWSSAAWNRRKTLRAQFCAKSELHASILFFSPTTEIQNPNRWSLPQGYSNSQSPGSSAGMAGEGERVFARERGKFFNPKKQQHKCGRWSMQGSTLSELTAKIFFLRSSNCFLASAN